jgi:hypothetical protein
LIERDGVGRNGKANVPCHDGGSASHAITILGQVHQAEQEGQTTFGVTHHAKGMFGHFFLHGMGCTIPTKSNGIASTLRDAFSATDTKRIVNGSNSLRILHNGSFGTGLDTSATGRAGITTNTRFGIAML